MPTTALTPVPSWPPRRPLVAILRGIRPDEVLAHAQALVDAGFDCIEVPANSPQWALSVRMLVETWGDRVLVGAGTISDHTQLDELLAAGGRLMVTPHTDPPLITEAAARGLTTAIGCATATEAFAALRAGASALKLFPAGVLGTGLVSALQSVLPAGVSLLAVGGIRPDNLAAFVQAGCSGAGLGSELYRAGQAVERTAQQARAFVAAWQALHPDAAPPPAIAQAG